MPSDAVPATLLHYWPDEDQEQSHGEQPAIDTHALRHGEDFISPRGHEDTQPFLNDFSDEI